MLWITQLSCCFLPTYFPEAKVFSFLFSFLGGGDLRCLSFCPSFVSYKRVMTHVDLQGTWIYAFPCGMPLWFFYSMYNVQGPGNIFRVLLEVVSHYEIYTCMTMAPKPPFPFSLSPTLSIYLSCVFYLMASFLSPGSEHNAHVEWIAVVTLKFLRKDSWAITITTSFVSMFSFWKCNDHIRWAHTLQHSFGKVKHLAAIMQACSLI